MPAITVVTTFHPAGLSTYGQRFIDSFAKNIDKRIKLLVYAENCSPINPDPTRIEIIDAKVALPKLNAFKEKWSNIPKANGTPPADIKARRPRDHHKAFKWDAVRFANKVYAVVDACEKSKDWCVWIDADTIVHSPWSYEDFIECLPSTSWITYVGRGQGAQTWPECGFYGLNLNDIVCQEFLTEFVRMYDDANNGIFKLEEWHDSFVFGHILNKMKRRAPNVLDYTAEMLMRTASTGGGGHPLINTKLGQWIDHLKGDRKTLGKSMPSDLLNKRVETYWQK
jgi:hypothetical protein